MPKMEINMKKYNKDNIPLAKALRKNMTKWERKLWYEYLNKHPIRFQRQKAIGNYIVDFYCAKALLAVELDGEWHCDEVQSEQDKLRIADTAHYIAQGNCRVFAWATALEYGWYEGVDRELG